jgi:hypothetical protein
MQNVTKETAIAGTYHPWADLLTEFGAEYARFHDTLEMSQMASGRHIAVAQSGRLHGVFALSPFPRHFAACGQQMQRMLRPNDGSLFTCPIWIGTELCCISTIPGRFISVTLELLGFFLDIFSCT